MKTYGLQLGDFIRYRNRRYMVIMNSEEVIGLRRTLPDGSVEEIATTTNDRNLGSWRITKEELKRFGFVYERHLHSYYSRGVYWINDKLYINRVKFPRKIKFFHEMQHIVSVNLPLFNWKEIEK